MSIQFKIEGMDEIIAALRELPAQMTRDEWGPIVKDSAEGMTAELKGVYPRVTGTLADRIVLEPGRDSVLRAKVRSKAPHAFIYEHGTVSRYTKKGAGRGEMPRANVFVPAAIRWRERMVRKVLESLRSMRIRGFSGSAEVRES